MNMKLSLKQKRFFKKYGFLLIPNILSSDEIKLLNVDSKFLLKNESQTLYKKDKNSKITKLINWNTSSNNEKFSLIARDERFVNIAKTILDHKTIYVYSHKITLKEPLSGGGWEWHQDFGYWHNNGCLQPNMLSIYLAIDKATKQNGCLQIYESSHKLGRLDHERINDQTCLTKHYLKEISSKYKHRYVELNSGDALVFDCNLIHSSSDNTSTDRRVGFIVSYNTKENSPMYNKRNYGNYEMLRKTNFKKLSNII